MFLENFNNSCLVALAFILLAKLLITAMLPLTYPLVGSTLSMDGEYRVLHIRGTLRIGHLLGMYISLTSILNSSPFFLALRLALSKRVCFTSSKFLYLLSEMSLILLFLIILLFILHYISYSHLRE